MPSGEARGMPGEGVGERWPHVVVLEPFNAGLAVARRMVRLGARVTLILEQGHALESHSRGVESVLAPFEPAGRRWLGALRTIADGAAEHETVAVLPATDRGSELLVGGIEELPQNVRAFELPDGAHLALMNKEQADAIARRAGVPVPWMARIHDLSELEQALAAAPWPCVVKPILSHEWRARYGMERTFLANDAEQAMRTLRRPLQDGLGMLLNQYVPGGDDDVEEAIVVRLADGSYPVRFGCRKLRQYPAGFGATALGESSALPETMDLAERVLDEAGFVGVAGVETKRHAQTGERWFLEVNVRIPGQWGLGDACGVDATQRLVAALAGRPLPPQPSIRPGVRVVFPELDAHVVGAALRAAPGRSRPALVWRTIRSYRGARELGLFDPRDPGPGLALAREFIGRRLARVAGWLKPKSRV
jgi:D-aspartate ligase